MVTATPSGIINVIRDEKNKTQHIWVFEGSNKGHKNTNKIEEKIFSTNSKP